MLVIAGFLGIEGFRPDVPMVPVFLGSLAIGVTGAMMVMIGVLSFVVAYGYLNGLGWSWTLGLIIAGFSLVVGLMSLPNGVLSILLDALIIYYSTRPYVRRYFGR